MTRAAEGLHAARLRGAIYERWLAADVFAPDGAGSRADPALPPFTIIQPPPNITGSLHLGHAQRTDGRGPDDPPRPDARPPDAVPARPRPRLDRRPVRPRPDHRQGGRDAAQSLGRERYLERMRAFVDETREVMLGQQRRVGGVVPTGAASASRWTRARRRPSASRSSACTTTASPTATEALINWCPGCRTSVCDLEVDPDARDGHAVDGPLPPHRRGDGRARSGRDDHRRDDPARDDPRRHRGRGPSRRRRATRASSAGASGSRSSSATCRSSPTTSSSARSAPARSRSRRPTTTTTTRPACATACRCRRSSPTTPTITEHRRRATTGSTATRPARRSSPTSTARGDLVGERPHEMVIGRCQRSDDVIEPRLKTQWFVRTGPLADARARGDPERPDPDRARAVREDLGALADEHPRLERVAASCGGATGSRPGTARTATSTVVGRADGPGGVRDRAAGRRPS